MKVAPKPIKLIPTPYVTLRNRGYRCNAPMITLLSGGGEDGMCVKPIASLLLDYPARVAAAENVKMTAVD